MTRERMVINIRKRLKAEKGIDVSKDLVNAILDIEQDEVYMIIAQEDSYKYIWGTIYGEEKKPKRISGMYTEFESVKKHGGYSIWKRGYPKVKWSRVTKVCENHEPSEFFAQPENRYTTEARDFRKITGEPEIPEYADLDEEKIVELCKRADAIQLDRLNKKDQYKKKRDKKFNKQKSQAMYEYWKKTGYIPMGADTYSEDGYTGEQRDTIDHYLKTRLLDKIDELTPPEKLEVIRSAIDIAEHKETLDIHPELIEYRDKYIEEVKNSGLEEIVHIKKNFQRKYNLRYDGKDDPWGFYYNEVNCKSRREERHAQNQEEFVKKLEEINADNEKGKE